VWRFENVLLGAMFFWMALGIFFLLIFLPAFNATLTPVFASMVIGPAYVVSGVVLWVVAIGGALRKKVGALIVVGAVPIFFVIAVVSAAPLMVAGEIAFNFTRFVALRPFYGRVIGQMQTLPQPPLGRKSYGLVDYQVDPGPPMRVLFPHRGQLLGQWHATIYDPSDALAEQVWWLHRTPGPARLQFLIGSYISACRPLVGHYYDCLLITR